METPVELGDVVTVSYWGSRYIVVGFIEWDRRYSNRKDALLLPVDESGEVKSGCGFDEPIRVEVGRLRVEERP